VDFEIERRFLVRGNGWRDLAAKHTDIRQAYLTVGNKASVRVRISDNSAATLTVKSRPPKLRRLELEYGIPIYEAEALIALREGAVVEKRRYQLPCGDISWEVDVFSGENLGLVIAEITLPRTSADRFAALDRLGSHWALAVLQRFLGTTSIQLLAGRRC
jgi:adenylate cyclase